MQDQQKHDPDCVKFTTEEDELEKCMVWGITGCREHETITSQERRFETL